MIRLDVDNPHGFRVGERVLDGAGDPCVILSIHKARAFVLFCPDDRDLSYATDWSLRMLDPIPANDTDDHTPPPVAGASLQRTAA